MANANILGDELYQRRARGALPVLIKQAEARQPISYLALAWELDMPNPRNLNHVLDCIGMRLQDLASEWQKPIPPIQIIVVNGDTGLPSEGVGWLFEGSARKTFDALPISERKLRLRDYWAGVYDYDKWPDVLNAIGIKPIRSTVGPIVREAAKLGATAESRASFFGAAGESAMHQKLKKYVSEHPEIIHLPGKLRPGSIEFELASGDRLDVHFANGQDRIAVEVKSLLSSVADIARGIFQCVKYYATIEAEQVAADLPRSARAVLVLEGKLPSNLVGLKNRLAVEVYEDIIPK